MHHIKGDRKILHLIDNYHQIEMYQNDSTRPFDEISLLPISMKNHGLQKSFHQDLHEDPSLASWRNEIDNMSDCVHQPFNAVNKIKDKVESLKTTNGVREKRRNKSNSPRIKHIGFEFWSKKHF